LTSRDNNIVQAFDLKQASNGPVQFDIPPYVVPSGHDSYQASIGQCYVQYKNYTGLLSLSQAGVVSFTEIIPPGTHAESSHSQETYGGPEISTDISSRPAVGLLEVKEHSEADLRSAYEGMLPSHGHVVQYLMILALFKDHFNGAKEREDEDAEAVYQMLDCFPSYFQNKEIPTESMLTT